MNASEHEAFVKSVHDVMAGTVSVEKLLSGTAAWETEGSAGGGGDAGGL